MRIARALIAWLSFAATACSPSGSTTGGDHRPTVEARETSGAASRTDIASTAPADTRDTASTAPTIVEPFPGITVRLDPQRGSRVEIIARTCLDDGLLEQVACSPSTREHESLLVVGSKPSQIHAAMLMAGFEPGAPGRWTYEGDTLGTVDPRGEKVDILVRYERPGAGTVEHPIRRWIRNSSPGASGTDASFPEEPWVFGGSAIRPNPPFMEPGEHYVADMTGSIIGLVTFGDEVIGFSKVLADQESVQAPVWEVNREEALPMDTEVTIVIQKWFAIGP